MQLTPTSEFDTVPDRETVIARVRQALAGTPARAAYLFGSWARGTADEFSDVDLAIVAETDRPFVDRFVDFPKLFELPWPVELLVYRPDEVASMQARGSAFIEQVLQGLRLL